MTSAAALPIGNDVEPGLLASALAPVPVTDEKSAVETDPELQAPAPVESFSIFTLWQKRWIRFAICFAGTFSTLSGCVYLPALVPMAHDLDVSLTLMNLTVTCYMVVAGIAPAVMGDMADQSGRRPVYILMFTLIIGVNLGMALVKSFAGLFMLRMVQSAGASGMVSVGFGVLADITPIEQGGTSVGMFILFATVALSVGPVLGGALAERLGWRWIFWFLTALTGTHFLAIFLFLPETQRKRVGNGSIPVKGIYWSLFSFFVPHQVIHEGHNQGTPQDKKPRFPNPLLCIKLLRDPGSLAVMVAPSLVYMVMMTSQTSLAAQCIGIYQLDNLQAGLVYLPGGVSSAIGSMATGKLIDRNYRLATKKTCGTNLPRGQIPPDFPLEATRLVGSYTLIALCGLATVGYGLVLMTKAHLALMLLTQTVTGVTASAIFSITNTMLTDYNPERSATIQAANNLIGCLVAGTGIAVLEPLVGETGLGWTFGIYGFFLLLGLPIVWYLKRHGMKWRQSKQVNETRGDDRVAR